MITMKLHHIGIVVQDIENGIQRYKSMFGFIPITEVINDPIQKVSVVLLSNPELDSLPIDARAHFQFTIKTD